MQMWRGKMVKGEVGQDFGQTYANFVVNGGIVDDNIVNDNIVNYDIDNHIRNDAIAYFDEKPKNLSGLLGITEANNNLFHDVQLVSIWSAKLQFPYSG